MALTRRTPVLTLAIILLHTLCTQSHAEPNHSIGCVGSEAAEHHRHGDHVCNEHVNQSPIVLHPRQRSQTSAVPSIIVNTSRAFVECQQDTSSGCRQRTYQNSSAKYRLLVVDKNIQFCEEKTEVGGLISPLHHRWFYALLSTLLISLAPFLIIFWIPINANDDQNQPLLRILLGFVSGGLLGDAFLHLIPRAIPSSQHHGHAEFTVFGLWILAGFLAFLIVEKVIRQLKNEYVPCDTEDSNSVETENLDADENSEKENAACEAEEVTRKLSFDHVEECARKDGNCEIVSQLEETQEATPTEVELAVVAKKLDGTPARPARDKRVSERKRSTKSGDIRVSGYLNLAADFAHNFTDGLAIGASFLAGHGIGWVTSLAILCHELPHEIGDFALLIRSGCSKPKAIALQFVTTVGAFAGCLVSLVFGATDTEGKSSSVMAFTAGGFIYIATVSIVPELLSDVKIWQSIKEIVSLLAGIGLMLVITLCE